MAEHGIPTALLLFCLVGYSLYLVWNRGKDALPEDRVFSEAALLTAIGVGLHALVDNCWTIPVMASGLLVLSLADPLPLRKREGVRTWKVAHAIVGFVGICVLYVVSVGIPSLGIHYNEVAHAAYDRFDYATAEKYHLKALRIIPDHPLFLDNLGMVYLQAAIDTNNAKLFGPAHDYFARAIAAAPQSLDPYIHMETVLVRLLSGGPTPNADLYQELIKIDTQMLAIDPFVPFPRRNLASSYYQLGNREEAFKQIQTAIHYEPNYVAGYLQLAAWYKETGDMESNRRYTAAAVSIVEKFRNFKPTEEYEGVLLARPAEAITRK